MSARRVSDLHRFAFVTGASAGLGRAFTEMLLADGVRVWGTARDASRLADLTTKHAGRFTPVVMDLAKPAAAVDAFHRAAESTEHGFDLVINNAGYGAFGPFEITDYETWQAQIDVLLSATMRLSHAAVRHFHGCPACLVNVSSLAAEFPLPFMCGYNAAKAGLSAFTESLVIETAKTPLTVIDFRPGDYRTAFNQAMHTDSVSPRPAADGLFRVWERLEANLRAAPTPDRAAADLKRAVLRRRSGTVRSGDFFQAQVAPFIARFSSSGVRRAALRRYFGLS